MYWLASFFLASWSRANHNLMPFRCWGVYLGSGLGKVSYGQPSHLSLVWPCKYVNINARHSRLTFRQDALHHPNICCCFATSRSSSFLSKHDEGSLWFIAYRFRNISMTWFHSGRHFAGLPRTLGRIARGANAGCVVYHVAGREWIVMTYVTIIMRIWLPRQRPTKGIRTLLVHGSWCIMMSHLFVTSDSFGAEKPVRKNNGQQSVRNT